MVGGELGLAAGGLHQHISMRWEELLLGRMKRSPLQVMDSGTGVRAPHESSTLDLHTNVTVKYSTSISHTSSTQMTEEREDFVKSLISLPKSLSETDKYSGRRIKREHWADSSGGARLNERRGSQLTDVAVPRWDSEIGIRDFGRSAHEKAIPSRSSHG